jgi:N6-adenosine-specific RNA methylase IME4
MNALEKLRDATRMLSEVRTAKDAKRLMDLAAATQYYAKKAKLGQQAIDYAHGIRVEAQRRLGEFLKAAEKNSGQLRRGTRKGPRQPVPTLDDLGLSKKESAAAQKLADIAGVSKDEFEAIRTGEKTLSQVTRELRREEVKEELESIRVREAKALVGVYDVVVIDPPWAMEKIERDVRPNQVEFDYPRMSLEELGELKIPVAKAAHVWLWTTQRFLPAAFSLLEAWGLKYVCTFVWHKPGGFQPIGLPQYNCEFALYARQGSPIFTDTKALPVCFETPRGKHSEKPEAFYEMVRRVTAGRRLDMFSRRKIDGFDRGGKEAG